ncbi:DoxX family protein [Bacillus sp. 165]|uniref:DoxX family protein n=1 Tax=Bacillus sp. 165 TaxID=1529117 RepID=UPI001ADABFC4|nr:DoxX family protein [Bacillus sp. 165]MBO9129989.1 DoxX family protein [Bacillus sp. 165]
MFTEYVRTNKKIAVVLTVLRLYLGIVWWSHGWEKLSAKSFNATKFLQDAIQKAGTKENLVQDWWAFILKHIMLPNVEILNHLIPVGEFFVAVGLLLGLFTQVSLRFALVMNFAYLFSGSIGVNPQMIVLSLLLLQAKRNAGKIGMDGIIIDSIFRKPSPPKAPPMKGAM